jgi:hypothetical protein
VPFNPANLASHWQSQWHTEFFRIFFDPVQVQLNEFPEDSQGWETWPLNRILPDRRMLLQFPSAAADDMGHARL